MNEPGYTAPDITLIGQDHIDRYRETDGEEGYLWNGATSLLLTTTGRKSGEPRESPMFYLSHGDGWAVVASNAASKRPPAWWLNLEAKPDAEAFVNGSWQPVRARRATEEEREALWPRFVAMYKGYDHYESLATREMPVVVLEPR